METSGRNNKSLISMDFERGTDIALPAAQSKEGDGNYIGEFWKHGGSGTVWAVELEDGLRPASCRPAVWRCGPARHLELPTVRHPRRCMDRRATL